MFTGLHDNSFCFSHLYIAFANYLNQLVSGKISKIVTAFNIIFRELENSVYGKIVKREEIIVNA